MTASTSVLPCELGSRPAWPSRRRALVLAGGGMRVAYQAGVVLALEQHGLRFDLLDGASGGTINAAMLMSGVQPADMCQRWRSLDVQRFASLLPLTEYTRPGGPPALGDADGIFDHVFPHLGIDVAAIRAATHPQATFNVCNYTDKVNEAVPHQRVRLEHLIAGISLPMFMPATEIDGKTYVDAVWIKDANLTEMVERGAEEIWLVWCIGNTERYDSGPLPQYVHMIEICANAALFAELAMIERLNAALARGEASPYGQTRPIAVHVVKPHFALPLDPEFFRGRITANTLISMGYDDAARYLAGAAEGGIELSPASTKMVAIDEGVSFAEDYAGTLDADEARFAGPTRLRFCVRVTDLAAFCEGDRHEAEVFGSADLPGLGIGLPLSTGRFVIRRAEASRRDRCIEFVARTIADDGRVLVVEAHKSLRDDPGFDMGEDLTTLAVTVRGEAEADGVVLARGTLRLEGGLLDVAERTTAIGAQGVIDSAKTVTKFLRFYGAQAFAAYRPDPAKWKFW